MDSEEKQVLMKPSTPPPSPPPSPPSPPPPPLSTSSTSSHQQPPSPSTVTNMEVDEDTTAPLPTAHDMPTLGHTPTADSTAAEGHIPSTSYSLTPTPTTTTTTTTTDIPNHGEFNAAPPHMPTLGNTPTSDHSPGTPFNTSTTTPDHTPNLACNVPRKTVDKKVNHSTGSSMHLLLAYGSSESDDDTPIEKPPLDISHSPVTRTAMPLDTPKPPQDSGGLHVTSKDDNSHPSAPQGSPNASSPISCVNNQDRIEIDVVGGYRNMAGYCSEVDSEEDSDSTCSLSSSFSSSSSSSLSSVLSSSSAASSDKKTRKSSSPPPPQTPREPPKKKKNKMLTPGELTLDDLPPIQDLKITLPQQETKLVGVVHAVVVQQVVIESLREIPPLDLDSVLFIGPERRALGQIFDVYGPCTHPMYVIRFNSAEHAAESGAVPGEEVYFAPSSEDHTHYVILEELMRYHGSDASGLQDNELGPGEILDFSDDEEEARVRRLNRPRTAGPRTTNNNNNNNNNNSSNNNNNNNNNNNTNNSNGFIGYDSQPQRKRQRAHHIPNPNPNHNPNHNPFRLPSNMPTPSPHLFGPPPFTAQPPPPNLPPQAPYPQPPPPPYYNGLPPPTQFSDNSQRPPHHRGEEGYGCVPPPPPQAWQAPTPPHSGPQWGENVFFPSHTPSLPPPHPSMMPPPPPPQQGGWGMPPQFSSYNMFTVPPPPHSPTPNMGHMPPPNMPGPPPPPYSPSHPHTQ